MKLSCIVVGTAALLAAASAAASGRMTIVSEDRAAASWTPAPGAPRAIAGYPAAVADRSLDVCVNIGFMIGADGQTSNFTQMKAWSSARPDGEPEQSSVQPFVQSAAAAVSTWRFVPAASKAHPIYTSASFAFAGGRLAAADEIRVRCAIPDLADFVARAKASQDRRGDLARARTERMRAEREQNLSMTANW